MVKSIKIKLIESNSIELALSIFNNQSFIENNRPRWIKFIHLIITIEDILEPAYSRVKIKNVTRMDRSGREGGRNRKYIGKENSSVCEREIVEVVVYELLKL